MSALEAVCDVLVSLVETELVLVHARAVRALRSAELATSRLMVADYLDRSVELHSVPSPRATLELLALSEVAEAVVGSEQAVTATAWGFRVASSDRLSLRAEASRGGYAPPARLGVHGADARLRHFRALTQAEAPEPVFSPRWTRHLSVPEVP